MPDGFQQIDGPEGQIALSCLKCEAVVTRRSDSFIPGAHVVICLGCGQVSSRVVMSDGEVRVITSASHRDSSG